MDEHFFISDISEFKFEHEHKSYKITVIDVDPLLFFFF